MRRVVLGLLDVHVAAVEVVRDRGAEEVVVPVPDDQAGVLPAAGELGGELRLHRPVVAQRRQVLADEVDRAERGRGRVRVELEVVRRDRQHAVGERRSQRALGGRAAVAGVAHATSSRAWCRRTRPSGPACSPRPRGCGS